MRILVDLQALQTGSSRRGIGRYARGLCSALLTAYGEHEFFLLFNSGKMEQLLARPDIHQLMMKAGLDHVVFVPAPEFINELQEVDQSLLEACKAIRELMIEAIRPDCVVLMSLVEFEAVLSLPESSNRSYTAAVVTHDFIPFTDLDSYMTTDISKAWYYEKIDNLLNGDLLLCNSMQTRNDAIERLSVDPIQCINIFGGCDLHHRFPDPADPQLDLISDRFVLYCATYEPRKNVSALISAYAALPQEVRSVSPLVLAGYMRPSERSRIDELIAEVGLPETQVRMLGFVQDDILAWLYKNCRVFSFPSLSEGLGLPPMEAMTFGAPVIVSDRTSLPEVVASGEQVFDPDNKDSFTSLLGRVLRDDNFARRLSAHGLQRSKDFSWRESANLAMAALEQRAPAGKCEPVQRPANPQLVDRFAALFPQDSDAENAMPTAQLLARASKELQRLQKAGVIEDIPVELLPPAR